MYLFLLNKVIGREFLLLYANEGKFSLISKSHRGNP